MKLGQILLLSFLSFQFSFAQLSGKVSYPQYGIEFTIPSGWYGQESEEAIYIQSNSSNAAIVISVHNYSLDQLKQEAMNGINEGNGTELRLTGSMENLNSESIAGNFEGVMNFENVKAYIIGVSNHRKKVGVSIIVFSRANEYSDVLKQTAQEIHSSFKFEEVSESSKSNELQEWIDWLKDVRLVYMDSYSSSGGGGYSSQERIDLCAKGYFNFNSYNDMVVSGQGISAYNQGGDQGSGTWKVVSQDLSYILQLEYYDGNVSTYELSYSDEKLYLNGYRYFRITEGEERPNCY